MKTEKLFRTVLSAVQTQNSVLNHLECEDGRTALESYPRRIVFELTNKCNFQCIMCGRQDASFASNDLSFSTVKSCEELLRRAEEATLFGWGEGTLHPRFREILEFLNTFPSLRKYFVTNGSTLPRIIDAIFDHHVDLLAVSIDGASAGVNDSIRKGGDFKREIRSIRRLVAEQKKRGAAYPYVNFVFTMMTRNIHELPRMVELAHELGIPEVKAVYLTVFNERLAEESLYGKQEIVRRHFAEAKAMALNLNINLKLPDIQGEDEGGQVPHKPCAFAWRDLYIGSDGFVRPCQSSPEKLLCISDFKSFDEIWNSPQMQAFRGSVNDLKLMSEACRHCYQSTCANWNMRHSFLRYGLDFSPQWGKAAVLKNMETGTVDGSAGPALKH